MKLILEARSKVHTYAYVVKEQETHRLHTRDWSYKDDFMPFLDSYVDMASECLSEIQRDGIEDREMS